MGVGTDESAWIRSPSCDRFSLIEVGQKQARRLLVGIALHSCAQGAFHHFFYSCCFYLVFGSLSRSWSTENVLERREKAVIDTLSAIERLANERAGC